MNDAVYIAALAGVMTVVNWRMRVSDRKADYARQDLVAERLKVADAEKMHATAEVAHAVSVVDGKADVIHHLVNSGKIAVMTSEMHEMERYLVLLKEVLTDPKDKRIVEQEGRLAELRKAIEALEAQSAPPPKEAP